VISRPLINMHYCTRSRTISGGLVDKLDELRIAAEQDLYTFISLIAPHRVLGSIHKDLLRWWTREEAKEHQLVLLPRDHQKSAMVAYRVAWEITRNPAVTILYISSTSNLAEKQLKFIKDILDSKIYRRYWSNMTLPDEGKREKWAVNEIAVDHPLRKIEGIREPTVFTAGLTTSITGLHCDICVLDDIVVQENAYTKEGRDKVEGQYSLLSSIESAGAREWAVGTRYHSKDLYGQMVEMKAEVVNEEGHIVSQDLIYEVFQATVEDVGDGSGEYLWPRQQRRDGKWFGFNANILATKRGKYLDRSQFRAQYYNNPNDPDSEALSSDYMQYYDKRYLEKHGNVWQFKGRSLSIFAAIDFAFSLNAKADYTALVTVGVDTEGNYYVLDIDRFRTNKIGDYFKAVFEGHIHWGYRKLRAEVTVAQEAIVEELRVRIRQEGLNLSIDPHRPNRTQGSKEERMAAVLHPRYENYSIWHYRGGLCQELEEELRQERPAHDDIKDALANAIDIAIIPKHRKATKEKTIIYHPRFGGVRNVGT